MSLVGLNFDPNPLFGFALDKHSQVNKIHLRVQQRNARQRITTLSGLTDECDLKKVSQGIRRVLCCSGSIIDDPESTEDANVKILQFSGDQRDEIAKYLVKNSIAEKDNIIVHGY